MIKYNLSKHSVEFTLHQPVRCRCTCADVNQFVVTQCFKIVIVLLVTDSPQQVLRSERRHHSGNTDCNFGKLQNTAHVPEAGYI
jgi:hypothetical protein